MTLRERNRDGEVSLWLLKRVARGSWQILFCMHTNWIPCTTTERERERKRGREKEHEIEIEKEQGGILAPP